MIKEFIKKLKNQLMDIEISICGSFISDEMYISQQYDLWIYNGAYWIKIKKEGIIFDFNADDEWQIPYCTTEEELFQHSTVYDLKGLDLECISLLKDMWMIVVGDRSV